MGCRGLVIASRNSAKPDVPPIIVRRRPVLTNEEARIFKGWITVLDGLH